MWPRIRPPSPHRRIRLYYFKNDGGKQNSSQSCAICTQYRSLLSFGSIRTRNHIFNSILYTIYSPQCLSYLGFTSGNLSMNQGLNAIAYPKEKVLSTVEKRFISIALQKIAKHPLLQPLSGSQWNQLCSASSGPNDFYEFS